MSKKRLNEPLIETFWGREKDDYKSAANGCMSLTLLRHTDNDTRECRSHHNIASHKNTH